MLMPYYSKPTDVSFNDIKSDLDSYFSIVDGVREFAVLGGEPFLHPQLAEILEYIAANYSEKICRLQLNSNGTVLPDEETLRIMRKYAIEVAVSDYSGQINCSAKIADFTKTLDRYHIKWVKLAMDKWVDFGSPLEKNKLNATQLENLFEQCVIPCRMLYNNKLYFCSRNQSAVRAGIFEDDDNDFFDLDISNQDILQKKKELLAFDLGYLRKGYLTFCNYCNGVFGVNQRYVNAGEQMTLDERER